MYAFMAELSPQSVTGRHAAGKHTLHTNFSTLCVYASFASPVLSQPLSFLYRHDCVFSSAIVCCMYVYGMLYVVLRNVSSVHAAAAAPMRPMPVEPAGSQRRDRHASS